jgi:hypothetical protein
MEKFGPMAGVHWQDAIDRYAGKTVKVTIDSAEDMKVSYLGKEYTIMVFTDSIEIAYSKNGNDCTWTFERGDIRLNHINTEFSKAQFALHHMRELLGGLL